MMMNKNLIKKMTRAPQNTNINGSKTGENCTNRGREGSCATIAKAGCTIAMTNATHQRKIKHCQQWYNNLMYPDGTNKGRNKE